MSAVLDPHQDPDCHGPYGSFLAYGRLASHLTGLRVYKELWLPYVTDPVGCHVDWFKRGLGHGWKLA